MVFACRDAGLVQAARAGDKGAFGQLVERHRASVCALAFTLTGSVTQSEEVAQETFVAAWRGLSNLRESRNFKSWLLGIAQIRSRQSQREQKRVERAVSEDSRAVQVQLASAEPSPLERAIEREEAQFLEKALGRIPAIYREPLVLFYQRQKSIKDVAASLGLSETSVTTRLSRGRQLLVEVLFEQNSRRKSFVAAVLAAIGLGVPKPAASSPRWATCRLALLVGSVGALSPSSWGTMPRGTPTAPRGDAVRASPKTPPAAWAEETRHHRPTDPEQAPPPVALFNYDFEDGVLPEPFYLGHVMRGPGVADGLVNQYAAMGTVAAWWNQPTTAVIFSTANLYFRETLALEFDYWIGTDGGELAVFMWNADRRRGYRSALRGAARERWAHATVPLSQLVSLARDGVAIEPGDQLVTTTIEGGPVGGKPFFVDNVTVVDSQK